MPPPTPTPRAHAGKFIVGAIVVVLTGSCSFGNGGAPSSAQPPIAPPTAQAAPDSTEPSTSGSEPRRTIPEVAGPGIKSGGVAHEANLLVTTNDGGVEILSPTGETVAVVAEGTGTALQIPPPVQATASPDGSTVALTAIVDNQLAATVWSSADSIMPDLGIVPYYYEWSPDGTRLIALGDGDGGVTARLLDVTTGRLEDLGVGVPHYLTWSPDGTRIASHRDLVDVAVRTGDGDELALDLVGGLFQAPDWLDDETILVSVPTDSGDIGYLEPTRQEIAQPVMAGMTQVPQASTSELRAVSIDENESRTLMTVGEASAFAVSPDRQRIAVHDGTLAEILVGRLTVFEIDTEIQTLVSEDPVVAFQWNPDGSSLLLFIASADSGSIEPAVWDGSELTVYPGFVPTTTMVNQYLPFWGQYIHQVQPWSPDGATFTYAASDADGDHIYTQTLTETEPVRIAEGVHVSWMG